MIFSIVYSFLVFFLLGFAKAQDPCSGWDAYEDKKCLKIFESSGLINYQDAENFCKTEEAHLISISHKEEQDFIQTYLKSSAVVDNIWIGLQYINNSYQWTDGTELQYTNWAEGSPKNNASYCVQIETEDALFGEWSDVLCTKKNLVICEKLQLWSLAQIQAELLKLIQEPVPMGFIYVQLPKENEPSEIWPSVGWKDVSSDYAGVFFRTVGGNAEAFGDVQNEDSPRLVKLGTSRGNPVVVCDHEITIVPSDQMSNYVCVHGDEGSSNNQGVNLRVQVSAAEVRPRNMAVKIWKRVEKTLKTSISQTS